MITGGLKMTVQRRVPMSLIDLWIAIDYSNADENESMIGDVRMTNKVLGTVKDTLFFCMLRSVSHWWMWRNAFSVSYQVCVCVCVCSYGYVAVGRIHPGTVSTSTIHVASVLRCPRTCRGVGLCFVDWTLFCVIIAFRFVQDVRYTYLKHTCFRWSL